MDFKTALKYFAREAVAASFWCENPRIGNKKLWKVCTYYSYTTRVFLDQNKETSETNFCVGNTAYTKGLASVLWDIWFGYVYNRYFLSDNKSALKIQNRQTGQIIYMGWYDGRFTVTELPPKTDSTDEPVELEE